MAGHKEVSLLKGQDFTVVSEYCILPAFLKLKAISGDLFFNVQSLHRFLFRFCFFLS